MGCPVVHFEITGKDPAKTQNFYGKLFDWDMQVMPEMNYGLVQAQNGKGIGGGVTGGGDMPTGVTVYVEVNDLQAYLDKATKLGATTLVPPTTIPGMVSFAMFSDPDGNMVGIVHSVTPPK